MNRRFPNTLRMSVGCYFQYMNKFRKIYNRCLAKPKTPTQVIQLLGNYSDDNLQALISTPTKYESVELWVDVSRSVRGSMIVNTTDGKIGSIKISVFDTYYSHFISLERKPKFDGGFVTHFVFLLSQEDSRMINFFYQNWLEFNNRGIEKK